MMTSIINKNTRLIDITVGDLIDFLQKEQESMPARTIHVPEEKKFVYGIPGLAKLLGCSPRKAQELKSSGKIDKAIAQDGRTIVIDVQMALELIRKHNQ